MTALNRQMRALVLDSYEEGTVFRDALINLSLLMLCRNYPQYLAPI